MKTVMEGTGFPLTFKVLAAGGVLTTPTTLHYRVDCRTNKREIVGWTELTADDTVRVEVLPAWNAIINSANLTEQKTFTVKVNDGLSTQILKPYTWEVKNIQGVM